MLRLVKITIGFCLLFSLGGCIETLEDAKGQYEYSGLDEYVEHMVEWDETCPIMTQYFNDSIFPKIVNELSLKRLAEISEKVKNHSTYKNFQKAEISVERIESGMKDMSPVEACNFYLKHKATFKGLEKVYSEKKLEDDRKNASFSEILVISDLLDPSPLKTKLTSSEYPKESVLKYFSGLTPSEGAHKYCRYRKDYPVVDSVYRSMVLPVLVNAPYETLKEISNILQNTPIQSLVVESSKEARKEYIADIQCQIDERKDLAVEVLDRIIIPGIQLELDSLSSAEADKVTEKFIGGFLNLRELALSFGRDEKKFKKLWEKHIHSDKYDEVFDKHIKSMLEDVYTSQQKYFTDITGIERKRIVYPFMSDPILIEYPKDTKLIQNYIKSNKFGYIKSLAEWVPYIGEAIMISDGIELLTNNTEVEKLEDKEAFKIFCQQLIVGQINDEYFEQVRNETIKIIDYSYDQLYKDITKNI